MIKSMTGFGRCEIEKNNRKVTVEIKSVNHRYLDVNMKMPKSLGVFESAVRNLLKEYIQRGKVDVFFTYEDFNEANVSLKYNETLAAEYLKYLRQMAEQFGIEDDIRVSTLSRYPEVLTMEQQDMDDKEVWAVVEEAVRGACEKLVESRITEGENLKTDLVAKLDQMLEYVSYIEERSPEILKEYRKRLEGKIQEVLGDTQLEESRIAAEVTIFADKICVDE